MSSRFNLREPSPAPRKPLIDESDPKVTQRRLFPSSKPKWLKVTLPWERAPLRVTLGLLSLVGGSGFDGHMGVMILDSGGGIIGYILHQGACYTLT